MSTLATLVVRLVGDTGDYYEKLDKSEKKTQGFLGAMEKHLKTVGRATLAFGAALGTVILGTLAVIGPQAISAASDFEESFSKVNVVFGQAADSVVTFSETTSTALGISQRDALAAAGTFGNLFRAIGLTESKSADMSTEILTLAADLASFNNLDPTEVLEKLRSGLVGETEPLRSLGINLTADAVALKAVEMGLAKSTKEVSQAALTQARFAMILDQSSLAQGDFARTASGLANTMRRLKAVGEDSLQKLGQVLLPMVNAALAKLEPVLFGQIIPAFERVLSVFGTFTQGLLAGESPMEALRVMLSEFFPEEKAASIATGLMSIVTGITNLWNTVVPYLKQAATWIAQNVKLQDVLLALGVAVSTVIVPALATLIGAVAPVIATVVGMIAAAALLRQAWENDFMGIRTAVQSAWTAMQPAFTTIVTWLQKNIPIALETLGTFWKEKLEPAFAAMSLWMQDNIPNAINELARVWYNKLLPAIQAVWGFIKEYILPMYSAVADFWAAGIGKALENLAKVWSETLYPALKAMYDWLKDNLGPVFEKIGKNSIAEFAQAMESLKGTIVAITQVWQSMTAAIGGTELPKDLTPGSPTPFEMGLRGILDAAKSLNQLEIGGGMAPALAAAPAAAMTPAAVGGAGGGGMGMGQVTIYIDGSKDPQATADAVIRAMQDRGLIQGTLLR